MELSELTLEQRSQIALELAIELLVLMGGEKRIIEVSEDMTKAETMAMTIHLTFIEKTMKELKAKLPKLSESDKTSISLELSNDIISTFEQFKKDTFSTINS